MPETRPPLRVVVVGAGPAGLYAAEALLGRLDAEVTVDLIERLPAPFGLVRYGVAPDHPTIKSIVSTLDAILTTPRLRFLGNVEIGADITHEQLLACYDAVVYAVGAPSDQRMMIPGEELIGSVSATDLVSWYNGHPDSELTRQLTATDVAVIGAGNVALDIARILARPYDDIATSDVPDEALRVLRTSQVRQVRILARRGPQHTKFSTKELRELGAITSIDRIVRSVDCTDISDAALDRRDTTNLRLFREWSDMPTGSAARSVEFRFFCAPVEIVGTDHVEGVRIERTRVDDDGRVVGLGEFETIPARLVVRAVGYRGICIPGLPFEPRTGVIPNLVGRVLDESGTVRPREYVAGWSKRGPSGVIGTNKSDARETVASLLADHAAGRFDHPPVGSIDEVLARNKVNVVTLTGWQSIDRAEISLGTAQGRARTKIATWQALTELARGGQLKMQEHSN
jgi:ferredoxin/flavodoxin---NADP+ reductase